MARIEPGSQPPIQPGIQAEQRLVDAVKLKGRAVLIRQIILKSVEVDPLEGVPSAPAPSDSSLAERYGEVEARRLIARTTHKVIRKKD